MLPDNTSVLTLLACKGETRLLTLNREVQVVLEWLEANDVILLLRFIRGEDTVVADSQSGTNFVLTQGGPCLRRW